MLAKLAPVTVLGGLLLAAWGCGRPAPTWLGRSVDGGPRDGFQGRDVGPRRDVMEFSDAGPVECNPEDLAIEACRPAFSDPVAHIGPAHGQAASVAEASNGNIFAVAVDQDAGYDSGEVMVTILDSNGQVVSSFHLPGMNVASVAANKRSGVVMVAADSVVHWLDEGGQLLGSQDLVSDPSDYQYDPVVAPAGMGFGVGLGLEAYVEGHVIPPLAAAWFDSSPGSPDIEVLADVGRPWYRPAVRAGEDGASILVGDLYWDASGGGIWRVSPDGAVPIVRLPGDLPRGQAPVLDDVVERQETLWFAWCQDFMSECWLVREDGERLRPGWQGPVQLVPVGRELWAVTWDPSGSVFLQKLDLQDRLHPVAYSMDIGEHDGVSGWAYHAVPTSRGVAVIWTSSLTGTQVTSLDCCTERRTEGR